VCKIIIIMIVDTDHDRHHSSILISTYCIQVISFVQLCTIVVWSGVQAYLRNVNKRICACKICQSSSENESETILDGSIDSRRESFTTS
jgi:hypothetical protein